MKRMVKKREEGRGDGRSERASSFVLADGLCSQSVQQKRKEDEARLGLSWKKEGGTRN